MSYHPGASSTVGEWNITPWAFPLLFWLSTAEVNRELLQSWSFYSVYSALCEIKINIESNFYIISSPTVELLWPLSPGRGVNSSHVKRGYWWGGSTPPSPWVSSKGFSALTAYSSAPELWFLGLCLFSWPPPTGACVEVESPEPLHLNTVQGQIVQLFNPTWK